MRRLLVVAGLMMLANPVHGYETLQGPTETLLWNKEKAFNGYTLFAARGTYLIDMEGNVVNTWRIGTNPRLLDNGNLLDASKDDPSGFGGFTELDWNGNVVWEYVEKRAGYSPHHDFVRIFNKKLNAHCQRGSATHATPVAQSAQPPAKT